MKAVLAISIVLTSVVAATAGVYPVLPDQRFTIGSDGTANPLPYEVFSQQFDDNINTMNPATPPERAQRRIETLKRISERLPKAATLSPEAFRELTADLIRTGRFHEAVTLLVPKSRERNLDFTLMANLVQAYALSGEWEAALRDYEYLLETDAPAETAEQRWLSSLDKKTMLRWLRFHRDLARNKPDPATLSPIALFGTDPPPRDSVAVAQKMVLDAPTDIFLLWTLAEYTAQAGDYRTAAKLFDRCTNSGLTQPKALMARRAEVQDIVDKLPKPVESDLLLPTVEPPKPSPKGLFDLVDPTKFWLIVAAFVVVAGILLALQVRKNRRRRLRRRRG